MKLQCRILSLLFIACVMTPFLGAHTHAFFSPDDQLTKKFIELIRCAKKSIVGAIYLISDKAIATEFVDAKKRGVSVQLVVDKISTSNYGKAPMLVQGGVDVFLYTPQREAVKDQRDFFDHDPLMHNKFLVVDNRVLWTGSYNWTVSANRKNQENAVLIDDKEMCERFAKQFALIAHTRCQRFKPDKNVSQEDICVSEHDEREDECFLLDMSQCA